MASLLIELASVRPLHSLLCCGKLKTSTSGKSAPSPEPTGSIGGLGGLSTGMSLQFGSPASGINAGTSGVSSGSTSMRSSSPVAEEVGSRMAGSVALNGQGSVSDTGVFTTPWSSLCVSRLDRSVSSSLSRRRSSSNWRFTSAVACSRAFFFFSYREM